MTKFKPRVRGSFSDRNGIDTINTKIQIDFFDDRTRNNIMNLLDYIIDYIINHNNGKKYYKYVYLDIFQATRDEMPPMSDYDFEYVREPVYKGIKNEWPYNNILDYIESTLSWINNYMYHNIATEFQEKFNLLFKRECVGYRLINFTATKLTNEEEIKSVESALNTKYDACSKSIEKALNYLYDRKSPDYENSVKESISAIEGMCNIINGTKNNSLGDALKELESNGVVIHGAMKEAFNKLYGYTSDKSGIRHNGGVDENTTFEEAQYMLVSCSAFLNYLICIYEK